MCRPGIPLVREALPLVTVRGCYAVAVTGVYARIA